MRLMTDGAELKRLPAGCINTSDNRNNVRYTSPGRTGNWTYQFYSQYNGWGRIEYCFSAPKDEIFLRSAVYIEGPRVNTSNKSWAVGLQGYRDVTGKRCRIVPIAGTEGFYSLQLRSPNDDSMLEVAEDAIQVDKWQLLESHFVIGATENLVEVKVDGIMVLSYSGIISSNQAGRATFGCFHSGDLGAVITYVDDIAVNDASGVIDNSWCGDGKVVLLPLNGDGTYTEWVVEPSGSLYTAVDEIPPDLSDFILSTSDGSRVTFTKEALNLPDGAMVKRLKLSAYADEVTEAGKKFRFMLRKETSDYDSGQDFDLGIGAQMIAEEFPASPFTYNAWTPSEIDSLEVGGKAT